MQFSKERECIIPERTGALLEKLLDGKVDSVALLFTPNLASLDNREKCIQYVGALKNEETVKQLDKSFFNVIHKAALKDKFVKLMAFMVSVYDDLEKAYEVLQGMAWDWIEDFLCDDKNYFRHLALYTGFSIELGKTIEKFFLKLTNTRKHGKMKRIIDGEAVLHDLYDYSPIASKDIQLDLFEIEVYGEACVKVRDKYQEIILLIVEIYKFSKHIDRWAQQVKENPEMSNEYLHKMLDEFKDERLKAKRRTNLQFYTDEIEDAKRQLPPEMVEKIANCSFEDMGKLLYHEIDHSLREAFSILMWVRIQNQKDLTDLEYMKVFGHIQDAEEKRRKAKGARILYAHWDELARNMVANESGKSAKHLDKGKMAYLMRNWTGTPMSQRAFVEEYHNQLCASETYHISVNTLNSVGNSNTINDAMENLFNMKAQEMIDKYLLNVGIPMIATTAPAVPVSPEIPAGLMAGEKTLVGGIQNASQL